MDTSAKPYPPISRIESCIGGSKAPPTMAIKSPADPNYASSLIPLNAIPYIVGNIMDIATEIPIKE